MDDFQEILAGLNFGAGRRAAPISMNVVRELTLEDLLTAAPPDAKQLAVKALRQSHHQLAKILSQGISNTEASIITGYNPERISMLKSDPSFKELLAYYTAMEKEQYITARADMAERLKSFGFDTIEELQKRLDEQPETFTNIELMKAMELVTDRTGHGKTATINTNHVHSLDERQLQRIREGTGNGNGVSLEPEDHATLVEFTMLETGIYARSEENERNEGTGGGL